MTINELCETLELDRAVVESVKKYWSEMDLSEIDQRAKKILSPETWEEGMKELQAYCGDDEAGMKILTVCLHCITHTYDGYVEKGIPEKIFWDTMRFIPRFLQSHHDSYGSYAFTWAWWMPRQISMREFRVGEYEYEFVQENNTPKINIHIPADANLAVGQIAQIYPFTDQFYPAYSSAQIYCDSWLLAPALKELLPPESNILRFQEQFELLKVDELSPHFMEWLYSKPNIPYGELPENTSLQKSAKRYLLAGGKIGTAYGVFKNSGR